jgi:hypothetical protein
MAWYDSIIDFIKDVPDNYKKYKDIVDVGGSAAKAYLDYKNQKARNELEESAYTDYMKAAEAAGQEAQAAIDLNLTPMTVTGRPTSKADVTSFQKVAQGGIIGLKNGGDPNAGITALRKKAPDVVKAMGFNKGGGPGIEALRKKAPDVVKRMGFEDGTPEFPIGPGPETDTVTFGTYDGNISFPRKEGESEEMAILNGLFNNNTLDEETKQSYYRLLIPQVYKNGEISKKEYDAMIEEIIVNKAKGGIIGLRKKYFKGSDPDDYDMDDRSVMEILRDEEGTTIQQQFEDEFGTLDNTANKIDGTIKIEDAVKMAGLSNDEGWSGINRAKRVWDSMSDDIQMQYPGGFHEFFMGGEWIPIKMKKGGRVKRAVGGVMDLGGMEKDYRFNGGFVPLGEYEKKDDVPARLSKNEFVFTADAVRAAGGGSINKGAKKMYDTMKTLEAQPTAKRMTA